MPIFLCSVYTVFSSVALNLAESVINTFSSVPAAKWKRKAFLHGVVLVLHRSNRNFNIVPPEYLTIFCARGVGNLTGKAFPPGVRDLTFAWWGGEN